MGIRAKFRVESKNPVTGGDGDTIVARPVVGGSPENDSFYKWTPGGELVLSTINEQASAQLAVGQEFYLDITPIEAAKAADPAPESAPAADA